MFNTYRRYAIISDNALKYLASSRSMKNDFRFYANNILNTEKESVSSNANVQQLKERFSNLFSWYEQLTGISEVRLAQNKVIETQEQLSKAQHKRREIHAELDILRARLREIQDELTTVSKGEEKYLVLTTQEHNLLKEEKNLSAKFVTYETEERNYFHLLTSAVKDSHERERIQANTTKYLSIIGSVIGTLFGIFGSTINNYMKLRKTKQMIVDSIEETNNNTINAFNQLASRIDDLYSEYHREHMITDDSEIYKNNLKELNTMLDSLKQTNTAIQEACTQLKNFADEGISREINNNFAQQTENGSNKGSTDNAVDSEDKLFDTKLIELLQNSEEIQSVTDEIISTAEPDEIISTAEPAEIFRTEDVQLNDNRYISQLREEQTSKLTPIIISEETDNADDDESGEKIKQKLILNDDDIMFSSDPEQFQEQLITYSENDDTIHHKKAQHFFIRYLISIVTFPFTFVFLLFKLLLGI